MADPLAEACAEAYLSGWALTRGPFTDRVRAGCAAAVATALDRPDDPRVLEVSLLLGSLEGTWAEVFRRREELTAKHVKAITAAWQVLVNRLDARDPVSAYPRELALAEADTGATRREKTAAATAVLLWLQHILTDPGYAELAGVIATAMTEACAEGMTAILAIAADQAAAYGFDWTRAYDAMLAAVTGTEAQGADAAVVQRIMSAAAVDAGRALAAVKASGGTDAAAQAAVEAALAAEDGAAALAADTAMSGFWGSGSVALAAAEGIQLNFMTAGDGRVCPACQDCEDNGPYDPAAFPQIPQHPRCRCCSSPADPLSISAFAAFLIPV